MTTSRVRTTYTIMDAPAGRLETREATVAEAFARSGHRVTAITEAEA